MNNLIDTKEAKPPINREKKRIMEQIFAIQISPISDK